MNKVAADEEALVSPARDSGIEVFRYLMALLVVGLHISQPAPNEAAHPWMLANWHIWIDVVGRSAVPFFFIASGYYFRPERGTVPSIKRTVGRLFPIYAAWYIFYLMAALSIPAKMPAHWSLIVFFDGGAGFHLWFLPALMFGMISLAASLAVGGKPLAIVVATAFAIAGPVLAAYHPALGLEHYPTHLDEFKRQLAAPGFVLIGYLLKGTRPLSPVTSLALLICSIAAMFAEGHLVTDVIGNRAITNGESLVSVFVLGVAMFSFARAFDRVSSFSRYAWLGRLSLSVYTTHILVIWVIKLALDAPFNQSVGMFVAVGVLATAAAAVLVRIPSISRLVT